MLLDSASLYFRAFFGVKESITAPDGTPVNAVRGFLDMIATLVARRRPTRLVACWDDDWRPEFRVAAIPSYKTHRVANPAVNEEDVLWARDFAKGRPELTAQSSLAPAEKGEKSDKGNRRQKGR